MDGPSHIAVLGAAGKMGSGIALLLLQEMMSKPGSRLTLVDVHSHSFEGLRKYLRKNLLKYAERNINRLRRDYEERQELIDNEEMILAFIEERLDRVYFVTSLEECRGASMIFEAILEEVEIKAKVFSKIKEIVEPNAYFFSNTSSIPIHVLRALSGIEGRLVGLHFYNPPAVQKLLEIIIPTGTQEGVKEAALQISKRLDKTIVFSHDIAGFIGNGHFIREVKGACQSVEKLYESISSPQALCVVNSVTKEYLIRPMGLFQLMDYVGIDVVQHIAKVMTDYLPGQLFNIPLINAMVSLNKRGGQKEDGTQKEGFFFYEKGLPIKVYDLINKTYVPYTVPKEMTHFPKGHETWKVLSSEKDRKEKIDNYFMELLTSQSTFSKLALHFLRNSLSIAQGLVKDGVAQSLEDVDQVLQYGFFHLYGVEEPWKGRC